ncbi:hypothetical protein, variant [Phytophthora nicotianae]|uniref:HECT-type E3 ubiquitin transferase n=2 Tax=Phytophthora nicotianae TaxID=4792 RepID=V9FYY1_PHYNI|nr:hypothetical protein F443_00870 [Phytophthora nicotianae P1569]ETK96439.1 hypothetical protein L915_00811 [Phytophthora nicotianae]ETI56685.1 hypothetical protein, variant [Phytophthora nicotianae P1569]ETK96440.1 hypothetical protein, variant [Phytophthora nicotianae]ETM56160.1 hypothetical protein L914_00799 [Phytophthora nicotianae]
MSVGGTIAVACALTLLLAMCFGWLARRSFKKFEREAELNAPLIDSDHRRLDAALRDAEEGFNKCAVCEFENFKRCQFCAICGELMRKRDDEGDSEGAAEKKKTPVKLSLLSIFRRESDVQLAASASISTLTKHATRRRVRAQRRKEWTRKQDVEGRMYWFRDSRLVKTDAPPAAFVAKFERASTGPVIDKFFWSQLLPNTQDSKRLPPTTPTSQDQSKDDKITSPTHSPHHEDSASSIPSTPEPESGLGDGNQTRQKPTLRPLERRMASLKKSVQKLELVLVPTSDIAVDASKLPLTISIGPKLTASYPTEDDIPETTETPKSVTEFMAFAKRDFPSKYAHFVMSASSLLVPVDKEHLRLNVERAKVLMDSMESLAVIPLRNLHSVMRINFIDENGIDAGGLQREWFVMLNEALVDPAHGLFVCTNKSEQTYFLRPCSNVDDLPRQLFHLLAAGRLLGRALLEGSMLCFHLAPPLLKLILGYPLSFSDLEDLDPEMYSNLRWLLDNDNVDSLGIDFTVTAKDGDTYHTIQLVPGGKNLAVSDSNKHEYVERKWQYLLVESIAPQLQVFLRGIYEIIPRELLLLFDPEEFDFLLCGSEEIDVDDWERNTKYSEGLHHTRVLKWFWELVHEMPNEYRRRLLQFATGSSRVPLGGFGALTSYDGRLCPFTLKVVPLVGGGFIHSHACFNRLDLPLHVTRDELKAVLHAILETEAYGFTTD